MMNVPPLRRRVVGVAVAVVALTLIAFGAFVYWSLRNHMERSLDELLTARVELAEALAEDLDGEALADQLARLGVPALVHLPDGRTVEAVPGTPRTHPGSPPTAQPGPRVSRALALPDGGSVEVSASRAGVDVTLNRLLAALAIGTVGAVALAALVMTRTIRPALAPMDHVVETAERTAAGETGARLRPDRDDTELGRMATAFDRMLDALEESRARTEAERERTQRFLAEAAHQLRTPIAGIRSSTELLLSDPEPEARDRALVHAVRESARAGRLITSLLHMARLDQEVPLRLAPTELAELCRREVERALDLSPDLDIKVESGPLPSEPVLVDGESVAGAVANLIDNARRHAERTVQVRLAAAGDQFEIRVDDDGPGLPPHAEEVVFERFTSLDGHGGSGLGLPIALAVARAHGGDACYEDGAFVLRLPRVRSPGTRPVAAPRDG